MSELVASEISQNKDSSSANSWENEIFGLVQDFEDGKSPAPGEFGDTKDARAQDNMALHRNDS